ATAAATWHALSQHGSADARPHRPAGGPAAAAAAGPGDRTVRPDQPRRTPAPAGRADSMRRLFRRRPPDASLPGVIGPDRMADGGPRQAVELSRDRLVLGGALFAIAFGVIALRLVDIAVRGGAAADETVASTAVERGLPRAEILDRNGVMLAGNLPTASLYANPRQVLDPEEAARRLVSLIPELDEREVLAKLKL